MKKLLMLAALPALLASCGQSDLAQPKQATSEAVQVTRAAPDQSKTVMNAAYRTLTASLKTGKLDGLNSLALAPATTQATYPAPDLLTINTGSETGPGYDPNTQYNFLIPQITADLKLQYVDHIWGYTNRYRIGYTPTDAQYQYARSVLQGHLQYLSDHNYPDTFNIQELINNPALKKLAYAQVYLNDTCYNGNWREPWRGYWQICEGVPSARIYNEWRY